MKLILNKKLVCQFSFVSLIFVLLFSSCRSRKDSESVQMAKRDNAELISAVLSNALTYDKFSAKLDFELKPGKKNKKLGAPATLRIVKGEILMLSIQSPIPIFSSEIFKLIVSPDSIWIIDRYNKMYVVEALNDVKNASGFAFDYQNLEALFTNQVFLAGQKEITSHDYKKFDVNQEQYVAQISTKDKTGVNYIFTSDYTDRVRKTEIESKRKSTRMIWSYDEFVNLQNDQTFPIKMNMVLNMSSDEATMNLLYSKIDLNGEFSIDTRIPKNYKQITLEQAIRIINNL